MSIYAGIFNATLNPAQLNMKSLASTIMRFRPNGSAPLFAMTAVTGKTKAKAVNHGYFSKVMVFSKCAATANALAAAGTITVDDTSGFVKGMVLLNTRTDENMRVLAVNSANELAVTRQFGRLAAAAITTGDVFVCVGNAHEQGSPRPTSRSIQAVYIENYTQIIRNAWALTDTARASYAEAGYSNIAETKRDCMDFHSMDIEQAMIFGQKYMGMYESKPIHATGGIMDTVRQYAPGNVDAAPATTSYDDIVDMVLPMFSQSADVGDPNSRVVFCDTTAMRTFQDIGREYGEVSMTMDQSGYGMRFGRFDFFKGTLYLKEHPMFSAMGLPPGLALVVDVPAVKLAYLDGRESIQENYTPASGGSNEAGNGVDAQGGSITAEFAVELLNPQGCGIITNLVAAKKKVYRTTVV